MRIDQENPKNTNAGKVMLQRAWNIWQQEQQVKEYGCS